MKLLLNLEPIAQNSNNLLGNNQSFLILLSITIIFSFIHIFSHYFHVLFKSSELIIKSFGGGLAVTYVFLHLLPELEQAGTVLGKSIYTITLLGFIVFYGIQCLILQNSHRTKAIEFRIFCIELIFLCAYNILVIYTLPEHLKIIDLEILLFTGAMGLHLLIHNYGFQQKYNRRFNVIASSLLVLSLFVGLIMDISPAVSSNYLISDILTAMMTGFILFNVFVEQLPHPKSSTFIWFLLGIIIYIILLGSEVTTAILS